MKNPETIKNVQSRDNQECTIYRQSRMKNPETMATHDEDKQRKLKR